MPVPAQAGRGQGRERALGDGGLHARHEQEMLSLVPGLVTSPDNENQAKMLELPEWSGMLPRSDLTKQVGMMVHGNECQRFVCTKSDE